MLGAKGSKIELFWGRFNRNESFRINFQRIVSNMHRLIIKFLIFSNLILLIF